MQLIFVLPAEKPGSGKTFAVTGGAQRFSVRKPCGLESLNFRPPVPIVFPLDMKHPGGDASFKQPAWMIQSY